MIILKKRTDDFLNYMISYTNDFDEKTRKKVISRNFEDLIYNFNSKVDKDTIYIECVESEVDSLLTDYISMLSAKKYIVALVFVDRNNSVDIIKRLDKIKKLSESYRILPTKSNDDKIRIYLAFYNARFSQKYEVDLAAKLFLWDKEKQNRELFLSAMIT